MDSLCLPRRISWARSEKPSTVLTREREARRSGLSAAILKINGKWRQRKMKAVQRMKMMDCYERLMQLSSISCEMYLKSLKDEFDALRKKEIQLIRHELESQNSNTASMSNILENELNVGILPALPEVDVSHMDDPVYPQQILPKGLPRMFQVMQASEPQVYLLQNDIKPSETGHLHNGKCHFAADDEC